MALMTYNEYFKKYTGKGIDFDGVYSYQCFDLVNDFCVKVLGTKPFVGAYAWQIYVNYDKQPDKDKFSKIANTPDFVPKKGDIIVWAQSLNGKAGHTAVCTGEGNTNYFYSYDENWDGRNQATTKIKHSYDHILGVLRPKNQEQITGKKPESVSDTRKSIEKKGIDISRYQGKPDFAKVFKAVDFVIVQSSFGKFTSQVDPTFERNYAECKKYGIPIGAYHFGYAKNVDDAKQEARVFMNVIKGKQFEYPVYYDIEGTMLNYDKATVSAMAKAFCSELEKNGYYTGIYMSRSPAQTKLDDECIKNYTLWLAEYNSKLNFGKDVGIWQYSDTVQVNGIDGCVDGDICYVDFPTIIKNGGYNGYKPTPKPVLVELDTKGYQKGDKGYTALAVKSLLKLAIDKGLVKGSVDDTSGLGNGSIVIINKLLEKWGYKQNGIAGLNFINRLYKELK